MRNFVSYGDSVEIFFDRNIKAGEPYHVGFLAGVAVCDGDKDSRGVICTRGVFEFEVEGFEVGQRVGTEKGLIVKEGGVPFGVVTEVLGQKVRVKLGCC